MSTESGGEPPLLDADPVRLIQVVSNLLDNAVKCTPRGGHIWVSPAPVDDGVRLEVRGTGIGIPADRTEAIFEPCAQLRESGKSSDGGLGTKNGRLVLNGGVPRADND